MALVTVLVVVCGPAEARERPRPGGSPAGEYDYYVLSLSWSPVYCESHPRDVAQCGGKRFGFVLHGLWPQFERGGYPSDCASSIRLDEPAREYGTTIYPSPRLVAHEWQKHGTCTGLAAREYFEAADRARDSIRIPDALQPGGRTLELTPAQLSSAIRDVNPGLTNRSVVITCSGPELSEVRVCLGRDLAPMSCGRGVRDACRSGASIRISGTR
ncbi:ribonuclease T2 [soil metagenome]